MFGKELDHEDRALIHGAIILIEETPVSSLVLSSVWYHNKKKAVGEEVTLTRQWIFQHISCGFSGPQNCEQYFLFVYNPHTITGIFVTVPQGTKTINSMLSFFLIQTSIKLINKVMEKYKWNLGFASHLVYEIIICLIDKCFFKLKWIQRNCWDALLVNYCNWVGQILGIYIVATFFLIIGSINLSWYTFLLNHPGLQTHCLISVMTLFPL